jgi:hypothetical protein
MRIQPVATLTTFQDYRCMVHGGANRIEVAMRRAEEAISAVIRSRHSTHLLQHRPRVPSPESWSDPCVAVPVANRGVTWRGPPGLGGSLLYSASGERTKLVMQAHETPKSLCRAVGLGGGCMVPWLGWGSLESCLRVSLGPSVCWCSAAVNQGSETDSEWNIGHADSRQVPACAVDQTLQHYEYWADGDPALWRLGPRGPIWRVILGVLDMLAASDYYC